MPLSKDKKFGLALRSQNIAIAKAKISEARVTNGNESWSSSDIAVDWMRARTSGYSGRGGDAGPGMMFGGYDNIGFADGGAY